MRGRYARMQGAFSWWRFAIALIVLVALAWVLRAMMHAAC